MAKVVHTNIRTVDVSYVPLRTADRLEQGTPVGYLHPEYAASFVEFGRPRVLPRSGGAILERQILGSRSSDAMGCYPFLVCRDWSGLAADVGDLARDLVSLAAVTDPLGVCDPSILEGSFDFVRPFKEHFVADLCQPIDVIISKHHRYYARKAAEHIDVVVCEDPVQYLDKWIQLYAVLKERHDITGVRGFSVGAFEKQLRVPGMVLVCGFHKGCIVGANLACVHGRNAYIHLSAFSEQGYQLRASYAIRFAAMEYLQARGVCWLGLGAGVGLKADDNDGLSQFKRGWSTGTRTVYFCGRVFDHEKYASIKEAKNIGSTDYFPAYRQGEFG